MNRTKIAKLTIINNNKTKTDFIRINMGKKGMGKKVFEYRLMTSFNDSFRDGMDEALVFATKNNLSLIKE